MRTEDGDIRICIAARRDSDAIAELDRRALIGEMALFDGTDPGSSDTALRLSNMRLLLIRRQSGFRNVCAIGYAEMRQPKYEPGGNGQRCRVRVSLADGRLLEISAIDRSCGQTVARILADRVRKARLHTYEGRI